MARYLLVALFFSLGVSPLVAAPVRVGHVQVEIISETSSIEPGQPFWVGLQMRLDEEWHVYWQNPGDAGLPPFVGWELSDGFTAGDIAWPTPEKISVGPLANYGYSHEVLLPVEITPPADLRPGDTVTLRGAAFWLVCKEECIPGEAELSIALPVAQQAEGNPETEAKFASIRKSLPKSVLGWRPRVTLADDQFTVDAPVPEGVAGRVKTVEFYPKKKGIIDHAATQQVDRTGDGYRITVPKSEYVLEAPDSVAGIIVFTTDDAALPRQGFEFTAAVGDAPADQVAAATDVSSVWKALLFAFLGGMILNLMPCVLPVLSLKILGFVNHATTEHTKPVYHGIVFAVGVLVSFWALAGVLLALQAGGEQLGWGFQLQSPVFLVVVTSFIFLFGLNLLGVFEMGTSLMSAGAVASRSSGFAGSFLNGVTATIVATPCTAPFMGSALGFSLSQPAGIALLIFTFLGLGMAAPYLVLSASPRLLRFLPKPGQWMETLKQVMGFLLLATVIWLLWVLSIQVSISGLIFMLVALLVLGLGAWILGRWAHLAMETRVRRIAHVVAIGCVGGALLIGITGARVSGPAIAAQRVSEGALAWERFSPQRVDELREAGTPVFIDFTAAWCLSCQVNERVALETEDVRARFAELGIVALKADWTSRDQEITAALAQFGRNSVPLYVLYDGKSDRPQILPEILTPGTVLDAIDELERRRGESSPAAPIT